MKKKKQKTLADLKLHETLKIGNAEYERVPGGWVRVEARACVGITSCFICEPEEGAIMCRPIGFQQEDL